MIDALKDYDDEEISIVISTEFLKHLKCIQEGYFMRIDKEGMWCSNEEPEEAGIRATV